MNTRDQFGVQHASIATPLYLYLFQRNECDRLQAWIEYHLALVDSPEHIQIVDNQSDDRLTLEILDSARRSGIQVRTTNDGRHDFLKNKGRWFAEWVRGNEQNGFYIPQDIDEFLVGLEPTDAPQSVAIDGAGAAQVELKFNATNDRNFIRKQLDTLSQSAYGIFNVRRFRNTPTCPEVYVLNDGGSRLLGPKIIVWGGGSRTLKPELDRGYHNPALEPGAIAHGRAKHLTFLEIHNQGIAMRTLRNDVMIRAIHGSLNADYQRHHETHYDRMKAMGVEQYREYEVSRFAGKAACQSTVIGRIAREYFGC